MSAYHGPVTPKFIEFRGTKAIEAGWTMPKYLEFCAWALAKDFKVHLDESATTVSKYILISEKNGGRWYKVRFSNHKPNKGKELEGDCDFFVGFTHTGIRTTEDAKAAVLTWRERAYKQAEKRKGSVPGNSHRPGHDRSGPYKRNRW